MLWIDYIPEKEKKDNSMKVVEDSCFESRILKRVPPKNNSQ